MFPIKKHSKFIIISSLFLILFFPLSFSTSSIPQASSATGQSVALAPDTTLPFELQEVVERVSNIPVPLSSDSLQVDSPAHRALFTPQGWVFTPRVKGELEPELSFSYRLSSISTGDKLLYEQRENSPSPTSSENRISYYRGEGITERYIATSQGIEQQFLLESPLPVEGDLIIRGRINTDLMPSTYHSTVGIEFQSRGSTIINYGAARVEDSRGECLSNLPMYIEGNELCLVVNGEWLREASYPVLIDPLVSSDTTISDANNYQSEPRVAYNSTDNTYLVVWEDERSGNYQIYGQRVNADGSLVGANIQIRGGSNESRCPDVAYNSTDNNWLVVWQEFFTEPSPGDWDVKFKVVSYNGAVGALMGVSSLIGTHQKHPRLAYNSTENNFCVVWEDDRDYATLGWEVYSRLVFDEWTPAGSQNPLVGYAKDQMRPAIAYLPSVNGYLVAWEDNWDYLTTGYDISCKRLDKDGLPLTSSSSWVVSASGDQLSPDVAANTTDNNFLVVWVDYRSATHYDIYGQLMSSADNPVKVGSEIDICTNLADQSSPAVCYSATYNRYLAAWNDFRPSAIAADIYGQLVKGDGTKEGGNVKLSSLSGVGEVSPHLAWNPSYKSFFLVQTDNRNSGTTGFDIFGRKVSYESTILTGMGYGGKSWYKAFDFYRRRFQNIKAFGAANPNGEIDVRVADLNNDGNPEMVVAHGSGGKSWIKIFNYDSTLYNSIKCFGASNSGGQVHLAVGNFDDDPGDLEIAAATGRWGNSWVKVFKTDGTVKTSFKAYGTANTQGEVYLAAADFDGDVFDEIITGTGIGGNSLVKIFNRTGTFQSSFYAFGSENTQGSIHLAAGNFDDSTAGKEIAVATGYGGTNRVKVFEQNGTIITSFYAFWNIDNPHRSVHIEAMESQPFSDGIHEIICGHGQYGKSYVHIFSFSISDSRFRRIKRFKAFGAINDRGEVYVSGCRSH